jgi:hypothetical protein
LLLQLFRMRCGRGGRGRGRHCLRRGNRRGIGSCRKSGTCWLDLRGRRRGSRISGRRIRESKGQPACTDYRQQACYASHRVLAEVVACFKFSRRGMTRRLRDYISERDWTGPGDTTGLEADPYTLADDPPIARIAPCPVGEHRRHRSGGSALVETRQREPWFSRSCGEFRRMAIFDRSRPINPALRAGDPGSRGCQRPAHATAGATFNRRSMKYRSDRQI